MRVENLHEDYLKGSDPNDPKFSSLVLNEPLIDFISEVTVADGIVA